MEEKYWKKYTEASNAMENRIDTACRAESDDDVKVIYSAYETDENRIPVDNLDKIAIKGGPYHVVVPGDDFFGDGTDYVSEKTYNDPTFLELAVEANKSIHVTKNEHHVFFEGAEVVEDDNLDHLLELGYSPYGVIKLYFGS